MQWNTKNGTTQVSNTRIKHENITFFLDIHWEIIQLNETWTKNLLKYLIAITFINIIALALKNLSSWDLCNL